MSLINEILNYNKEFVETKQYQEFLTTKFPDKRMVVLHAWIRGWSNCCPKQ